MNSIEKELAEWTEIKEEHLVSDVTKIDHWLIIIVGIVPFIISSIWYYLNY